MGTAANPRRANSTRRNRIRAMLKSRAEPCHICGQPIDYSLKAGDPMSFEIDEIVPVSRFWEGGYKSAAQCALDANNCRAAHRRCNQKRGNKRIEEMCDASKLPLPLSRQW